MTISSVKTGAVGVSLLAGNTYYDPAATFLIERVTSTGSIGSVSFTSIPSTYKHLQIRMNVRCGRSASTDQLQLQFNSDTGSNYVRHLLKGDGTSATASGTTGAVAINLLNFPAANATADQFGSAIIDIHDYASSSKNTTVRFFNGWENNSGANTSQLYLGSGLWLNTAAVTSIQINPLNAANFVSGTTFAIYGMVG